MIHQVKVARALAEEGRGAQGGVDVAGRERAGVALLGDLVLRLMGNGWWEAKGRGRA